jgi:acylphosphatase
MILQHLNIRVTGKVQGVYFRVHTCDKARALGLKGFVRNEADGSVYLEAEGPADRLEQLVNWCKQGPPRAVVQRVDISPSEIRKFQDFLIER